MDFEVVPYRALGPIELGMPRERVRQILGSSLKSSEKAIESGVSVPARDLSVGLGVRVEYDDGYKCCSIEATHPARPTFQGMSILEKSFRELKTWFQEKDPQLQADDSGLTSFLLGVGVYAPLSEEDPDQPIESMIVFREGYYDSAHS